MVALKQARITASMSVHFNLEVPEDVAMYKAYSALPTGSRGEVARRWLLLGYAVGQGVVNMGSGNAFPAGRTLNPIFDSFES